MLVLCTLNQEMILMSDDGKFRDWRGILSITPLNDKFKNSLKSGGDPKDYMKTILYKWVEEDQTKKATIKELQDALRVIDRFDIYDDTLECFQVDAKAYKQSLTKPVLDRTEKGSYIITSLDRSRYNLGQKLIIYDAFLMYSESDEDFAELIKTTLEKFGMHICIKNDFLGGIPFEHDAAMTLIAERCRRVIIIVSKSFMYCSADTFISKYAQHIGIEQSSRKIVPCLREDCVIPSNLRILFHLKYYKDGRLFKFWMKLYEAVAFDASEKSVAEGSEYERIPHNEYTDFEVPPLSPKKDQLMLLPVPSSNSDNDLKVNAIRNAQHRDAIGYLGPNPPMDSPNNSSIFSPAKKKNKNPMKHIKKLFGKKKKVKEPAELLTFD